MSTKEVEAHHLEGPPWKIVGRFSTFEDADIKRNELIQDPETQVKVHYQGPASNRYFAVKVRTDPSIAPPPTRRKKRRKK